MDILDYYNCHKSFLINPVEINNEYKKNLKTYIIIINYINK